jgi:hypothetical protein
LQKIQDLERRALMHPALRAAPLTNANRSAKNLPRLSFLNSTSEDLEIPNELPPQPAISDDQPENCQPPQPAPAAARKRRRLFAQKNTPE